MSKTIQILSILMLSITLIGTLFIPNNPAFWLATSSISYTVVRGILIFIIYSLLLFGSPPTKRMKVGLGGAAFLLLSWSLINTYNETIQFLDGMSFAAAAVAIWLSILQPDYGHQGAENWEIISERYGPQYSLIRRQMAYYALVVFMVFGIYGSTVQHSHHFRHLLS